MLSKSDIKYIQSLQHKKFRDMHKAFVAEGEKLVQELLLSGKFEVTGVYAVSDWQIPDGNTFNKTLLNVVDSAMLERISGMQTPNKVLGVFRQLPEKPLPMAEGFTLLLDDIRDPGNLGTIIRTADWFGIKNIVCSETTVELYNPKVIQGTMGSICRVPVYYGDLKRYIQQQKDIPVFSAVLHASPLTAFKKPKDMMLVIGNEANGVSEPLRALSKGISIPGSGNAESLNAAIAAAILMYACTT